MPFSTHAAFRCRNCGHLESAEHAGENAIPHACSCCGAGVSFSPHGVKQFQPANWEVLADVTTERLVEIGLEPGQVARHEGKRLSTAGKAVTANAVEQVGASDRS